MTILQILFTIFLAIAIGSLFYFVFRVSGPWGSFWSFLAILVLVGIAAEAWIGPMGPTFYGTSWVGSFVVILLVALLIAAATPGRTPRRDRQIEHEIERSETKRPRTTGLVALGMFFWFLIIFLAIIVITGLLHTPVV